MANVAQKQTKKQPREAAKKNTTKTDPDAPIPLRPTTGPSPADELDAERARHREELKAIFRASGWGVSESDVHRASPSTLMLHALSTEPSSIDFGILQDVATSLAMLGAAIRANEIGDEAECAVSCEQAERYVWSLRRRVEAAAWLGGFNLHALWCEVQDEKKKAGAA